MGVGGCGRASSQKKRPFIPDRQTRAVGQARTRPQLHGLGHRQFGLSLCLQMRICGHIHGWHLGTGAHGCWLMMLPASGFGGAQTGIGSVSGYEARVYLINQGRDTLLKARMVATRHLKRRPLPFAPSQ